MTTQTSRLVIEIDSRNAERNTRAVANELENLTIKGDKADAQLTEMSSSIKSLVGYMGGLLTINKAIAMADGYTQMAARIRNATSSAEEYDLVQKRVLATANTTYRALSEAQEVYLSLAGGMKSLGKSTTQTLDLVDSLSFSFTHNATRTDQAQSAMDSLSKSMAKNKVDADAWISIVTGADNVIADMAKTTGKTEAEIRKLGAEGKASLEDLIQTLIATREQNEKLANNMENSLADGFTTLSNAVTVYLGKANESTSATGIMAGALGELAQNLESVANENAYSVSSLQLQLGYGQQMASSMSSMMGAIFGEKSKAYAAAFAVEKAFAVAQAAIAMGQNIAQASAIGFPQNIPMIAGAMAQGAQIASIIASVAAPTGYSDGGFTGYGGKFDPAGIVHKGEVVWSQEDIKRWGGVNVVEAMRTSRPPKGYSDGGLVTPQDTYRVGMGTMEAINRDSTVQAERQAQASAKAQSANPQPIENNLRVIFVRDENEAKEMLYGPDGEKAFLYHQKRNKSKLA